MAPTRTLSLLGALLGALALAAPARADDLADAAPLIKALEASRKVLLLATQAVSPACVDALRDMTAMQDQLALDGKTHDREIPIVRDVLATDYDTAARSCGADAVQACAHPGTYAQPGTAFKAACTGLLPLPPP